MENTSLNKAKFSILLMAGSIALMAFVLPPKGSALIYGFLLYLIAFLATHIFLGKAANQSGRSWVLFGLLPVLWPAIGSIISYFVLCSKIKSDNS